MRNALVKTPAPLQSRPTAVPNLNTDLPDYCPEIDGLRAIAVLLVVFCHAQLLGRPQMPAAFKHFKEVHPHSYLGYKSPSMFGKELLRQAQIGAN